MFKFGARKIKVPSLSFLALNFSVSVVSSSTFSPTLSLEALLKLSSGAT